VENQNGGKRLIQHKGSVTDDLQARHVETNQIHK